MPKLSSVHLAPATSHRFGPACLSLGRPRSGSSSRGLPVLLTTGIRSDEDDDTRAETFVLRIGAGRVDVIDAFAGLPAAVASSGRGAPFVLDTEGTLHSGRRRCALGAARTLAPWQGGALVGGDRLWRFDERGEPVDEDVRVAPTALATSRAGILMATEEGLVFGRDLRGPWATFSGGGEVSPTAITIDDHGHVAAIAGRQVFRGRVWGDAPALAPLATAPFALHAIAQFRGRVLVSSRDKGLFVVLGDAPARLVSVRPSLRVHTFATTADSLVCAADLLLATSDDGVDFLSRDLSPFVRVADKHGPVPR